MLIIGKVSDLKAGDDFVFEAHEGRGVSGLFLEFVRCDADVNERVNQYLKDSAFMDIRYILDRRRINGKTFLLYFDGSNYRHVFINDTLPAAIVRSI